MAEQIHHQTLVWSQRGILFQINVAFYNIPVLELIRL